MAKRRKNGQMSDEELETRRYHKDVRKLQKVCEDNNIILLYYEDATDDDVCILSNNEYEIGATKEYIIEGSESYFVHEKDFSKTQQLFDHE